MHRINRAAWLTPVLALTIAACAAPNTGGQASDGGESPSTAPSASAAPAQEPSRVDIGVLATDPAVFAGTEFRVLARVDEVVTEGESFYTSPSGTEDGRLLVVLASDAGVEKEIGAEDVLWIDGMVVEATPEALSDAGALSTDLPDGYAGEYVVVASGTADPLGS